MTSFTGVLSLAQAEVLREILRGRGFQFVERPYTIFAASKGKLQVAVYERGPKVLVQGQETEDFVRFTLEPEVFQDIRIGYEEERFPEMFSPHFGIDESGKGDFFGPLVFAGVYVDQPIARALLEEGVCDSKKISSDAKIRDLAKFIRETPGLTWELVRIGPSRYNELVAKLRSLNRLMAWGHATVLENLMKKVPACPRAISDQFADPAILERVVFKEKKLKIQLIQRTKAESDPAVAAASILAREGFINWLSDQSRLLGVALPRGASLQVQELVVKLRAQYGEEHIGKLTKTHFKLGALARSQEDQEKLSEQD